MLENLTIVLGGAASGKSDYAESLVLATGLTKTYIATAQAYDAEMQSKIDDHRAMRGDNWTTIEAPIDVCAALKLLPDTNVALLDCATMWLSNILLDNRNIVDEQTALLQALKDAACPVVLVTNEVGAGIVPENALARQFRNAQGRLNQALAAQADTVITVMAGLPLALKGRLPQ